jgi:hypothetical protein
MKKAESAERDTMRAEYTREELGTGVRGKYYKQYMSGTNLVLLSPDVAKAFPTAEAVNSALRTLLRKKRKTSSARARTRSARTRRAPE